MLASVLKDLMLRDNITVVKLADMLGINVVSVRNWTYGKTSPSDENLSKLCKLFDVDVAFLNGEDTYTEVEKLIVVNKGTKKLSGMKELRTCCYACYYYRTARDSNGFCKLKDKAINSPYISYCTDGYREVELLQCEICSKYVRSLGCHVKGHNITADQYKQLYGYNRTTGLACEGTRDALKVHGLVACEKLVKHNKETGHKPSLKRGYTIRDEGRMHMKQSKQNISQETKTKMSKARKGVSINKGHVKSNEWRAKLSASHKNRLKNINRTIIRDNEGKIISYSDRLKYWKKLDKHWAYREVNNNN